MAHFAKIGLNSEVIEVLSVHNDVLKDANGDEQEALGLDFLTKLTGWAIWKQTSYNTRSGVHKLGGTPFRKNFAGEGLTYDEARDAFIHKQPYPSWILNETTCRWDSPVPQPSLPDPDGKVKWDEENQAWVTGE